jgi:hypothetical protein
MATKVHKRLVEVAKTRFGEKRQEFVRPPRSNGPTRTVPRWEQVFLSRAATSEHKVFRYGPHRSEAKGSTCSKGGKVRSASKWLLTKCTTKLHEGVDGQALHASHSMAHRQGVRMCQVCGCYSVKTVVTSSPARAKPPELKKLTSRGGAKACHLSKLAHGPWRRKGPLNLRKHTRGLHRLHPSQSPSRLTSSSIGTLKGSKQAPGD